jgi:glycosyltransferase involved in cell wall biosynthesis/SAM-dependent methyltransferase
MSKLLILTRYDRTGPSSRYRFYNYVDYLEANGVICDIKPLFNKEYLECSYSGSSRVDAAIRCYARRFKDLFNIRKYDLVLIEKELFPFLPAWFESYFYLSRMNYILDYDDAIFHRYDQHKNKLIRLFLSEKIAHIMKGAVAVISGNRYISDYANKHAQKDRIIIPTVVDTDLYDQILTEKNQQFTIVWIGTQSTAKYVEGISNAIKDVCIKTNGKFVMIGATASLPSVPVEFIEWSEDTEIRYLKSSHVGIMPLPNHHWERGKCGFKIIQYMASKIPVVASPVGVNSEIIKDGVNGYLATTENEWVDCLFKVYNESESESESVGVAGYKNIVSNYSFSHAAPILLEVLEKNTHKDNLDKKVVDDFGFEWSIFDNEELSNSSLKEIWEDYFHIFPWHALPKGGGVGADIGCGSGRWAKFVAPKVKKLYLIDPSKSAVNVAKNKLLQFNNLEFLITSADRLLVDDESLDFAYSLGVLHHIPNINQAFQSISKKLKKGAPFLVYLYYSLDNKPVWYRYLWKFSDLFRILISTLPFRLKYFISQLTAILVYWPIARLGYFFVKLGLDVRKVWPLIYYSNKPFYVMKNDALDRFGTRLEQRFSKIEIKSLFIDNGFTDIKFSDREPYWCVCGIKK